MPGPPVIGVDAGGTKMLAGVVGAGAAAEGVVRREWGGAGREETVAIMVDVVQELRAAHAGVAAVGFGIPSLVERDTGLSRFSNHLPLDDFDFAGEVAGRVGLPAVVDNDGTAAALAELRIGAARGFEHAVLIALGTGIAGGLILDGRVYRGAHGFAGEAGHMVVDYEGEECPGACPGRGCLEALASGRAIGRAGAQAGARSPESPLGRALAEAGGDDAMPGELVTELAHEGDAAAREALAEVGRRLGAGLIGIANLLDPELIVIGGGAVAAGDLLLEPAREVVRTRALPPVAERVRIVPAAFGEEAGLLGAALMAREAVS